MYDRLKGFRDRYPPEMAARREVIDTVEEAARQRGFREIATPALERTQMFVDKSGPDIVDELYAFTDKGGRDITLTPELTPTVARMVVERGQALPKPIKWFSTRPFWRYEQVQQGRFREFYQTNIDIFGSEDPAADAEILAVAAEFMTELGLPTEEFEFRVSHRDVLSELLGSFDATVDTRAAIRAVDKRADIEEARYFGLLEDAGLSADQAAQFDELLGTAGADSLDDVVAFGGESVGSAVENLRAVLAATEAMGVREHCTVSLSTARGLDYYTGVVFECFDTHDRISRAIFGGGRYDELIESFGGPPTPAVGVAPGVMNSTLPLLLEAAGVLPAEALHTDYYVLTVGDVREVAAQVAAELRAKGHVVETDVIGRGFGDQLEYADRINAETTVVVGERDLADGDLTIKDMASGEQTTVPVDEFPGPYDRPTYADFA
ncbi:MAG: histidine--tRNA ligase [Halobacteriaceae archaeon]